MAVHAEVPALALEEVAPQVRSCLCPSVTIQLWLLCTCAVDLHFSMILATRNDPLPASASAIDTAQLTGLACISQ